MYVDKQDANPGQINCECFEVALHLIQRFWCYSCFFLESFLFLSKEIGPSRSLSSPHLVTSGHLTYFLVNSKKKKIHEGSPKL